MEFQLNEATDLCWWGECFSALPLKLDNPNGFLIALGDFLAMSVKDSVEALISLWHR